MLLKLLGLIDIIVAILLLLTEFGMGVNRFYILFVIMHAIKAVFFLRNVLSLADLAIVAYTLLVPFWSFTPVTILIVVFLFYKGLYSML